MLRLKTSALSLLVVLFALFTVFTLSACDTEYDAYEEDYRYARQTIVGEWRVQEALLNQGTFIPYTPGSVMSFDAYGNYNSYLYGRNEEERGTWRMERRSDGSPYIRINLPLSSGYYDVVYANIAQINDNYVRLWVEDQESSYTLILTRTRW